MIHEKIKLIISRKDFDGNRLSYDEETGKLQMSQADEPNRWRPIGRIISEDGLMIYQKYEKEKDKYLKYKAWSVIHIVLEIVDAIRYETESFVYYINKSDLFKFGVVRRDKGHANSMKVVCPIRHWTTFPKNKASKKLLEMLGYEWFDELRSFFQGDKMKRVSRFVAKDRKNGMVYPSSDLVFRPFKETPYTNVKVVLLGESPFKKGDGLAFSDSKNGVEEHTENKALLDWIEEDVYAGFCLNRNSNLEYMPYNGVLLMNAVPTANNWGREAHFDEGWEDFTKHVIKRLATDRLHQSVVFMVLGKRNNDVFFKFIENLIMESKKHLLLSGPYPGEQAENPPLFSQCNDFLVSRKLKPIPW